MHEHVSEAEIAALAALAETPPQSIAGLLAALDRLRKFADESESLDLFIQTAVKHAKLLATSV